MWANPFSVVLVNQKNIHFHRSPGKLWKSYFLSSDFCTFILLVWHLWEKKSHKKTIWETGGQPWDALLHFEVRSLQKKKKHHHLLIFWKTASNVKEFSESYCNLVWSHFGFICNIILPTMISFSSIAYMHKKNMNSQKKLIKAVCILQ